MNNLELLQVYKYDKKIRLGTNGDGGYVMAELDGGYDCYISAGILDEESFSRDFIDKYIMTKDNSFGFDGTINDYPYQYTNKITFFKKNIGPVNNDTNSNLSFLTDTYNNIFLKMDIESGEYPWLLQLEETQLSKFKQIVMEFHGLTGDNYCYYINKVNSLQKLAKTHYIVHAHGNNCGQINRNFPDIIEFTFVNKNQFSSVPEFNEEPLPNPTLDYPNRNHRGDVNLNYYPFVHSAPNILS